MALLGAFGALRWHGWLHCQRTVKTSQSWSNQNQPV
jgi:hypothetical protein